jgi:hypothetical protein
LVGSFLDTDTAEVTRYEHQVDDLAPWPSGVFRCPYDDGSVLLAIFSAGHQVVVVQASLTGCRRLTSGRHVSQSGPVIDTLVARIKR